MTYSPKDLETIRGFHQESCEYTKELYRLSFEQRRLAIRMQEFLDAHDPNKPLTTLAQERKLLGHALTAAIPRIDTLSGGLKPPPKKT